VLMAAEREYPSLERVRAGAAAGAAGAARLIVLTMRILPLPLRVR
jgi:hypothetical protein